MSKVRLFSGDCREVMATVAIPDGLYDAVITDPPYFNQYAAKIELAGRKALGGQIDFDFFENDDEFMRFTKEWIALAARKLRKGGSFVCFTNLEKAGDIIMEMKDNGLVHRGNLFFRKTNPPIQPRRAGYLSSVEPCIWAVKPGGKTYFRFTTQDKMLNWRSGFPWCTEDELDKVNEEIGSIDMVIEGGITQGLERTVHPTQKPIYLMRDIIMNHVPSGGTILEPFGGSGSTLVAAISLGISVDGIEQDERYLKVIRERLRKPIQTEFVDGGYDEQDA